MKKNCLFVKVFTYTIVSILLLVIVTGVLFSQQFLSFYRTMQTREIVASYEPFVERIKRGDYKNIDEIARRFYESNQSFEFHIMNERGDTIYATPNAYAEQSFMFHNLNAHGDGIYAVPKTDAKNGFDGDFYFVVYRDMNIVIVAQSRTGLDSFYQDLSLRVASIFAVMLSLCLISAYFFAGQMTKPIKILADSTNKMANLEEVSPPLERQDELGELAQDVYFMYSKLKETISKLEDDILRKGELEEAKRYFFSAASHELKTPIAATSIMLEGMLENIGDYRDHSKYLRECVKMMDTQSELISEILEIVNLEMGKVAPSFETLNVSQIMMEQVSDYQILAERNGLRIAVDIPYEETCVSDARMLKRVFSNILLNAIQNTPSNGEIRIWLETAPNGRYLHILNTDARIDDRILPKLFDPFYRVDKARRRKNGNNGLGLTIVSKTLETLGMSFNLENASDGVLFWVELPKET